MNGNIFIALLHSREPVGGPLLVVALSDAQLPRAEWTALLVGCSSGAGSIEAALHPSLQRFSEAAWSSSRAR